MKSHSRRFSLAPVLLGVLAVLASPAMASHVGETLTTDQQLVSANDQLVNALSQWERMPASVREARASQLTAIAAKRQEHLIALLQKNPKVAAARMMPAALRDRLPAQAAAFVEVESTVQGTVFASVADDIERGISRTEFKFQSNAGGMPLNLYLADSDTPEDDLLKWAGKRLSAKAMRIGEHLAVLDRQAAQLEAAGSTSTSTGTLQGATMVQGVQKTLSILLNFNDKPLSCTAADVNNRLFGTTGSTVNTNYRDSSRGLVSFSGQVVGPFNINYSSTGSCDYNGWASAAEAAARAAGIDPSQFSRVNYVTPSNGSCGWGGLAYMPGRQSWVQMCGTTGLFSHELGHNLSLHHAASPTAEYGDASDPMGGAKLVGHNAANRTMAGWMPAGSVLDVASGGSYSLATLSNNTIVGTPQVLRLAKRDTGESYYVSTRSAMNLDTTLALQFVNTVSVHRASGTLPVKTVLMQVLAAGQTFTDASNGITITNQGVASGNATVGVTMAAAACTRALPSVSVSPASQTALPGASRAYTVKVTNRNSSGCGTSSFALGQVLPAGFTGTFSTASLSLGAGATGSATWTATSSTTLADGSYGIDATATDTASTTHRTSAHATYSVYRDATAPSLTITSPSTSSSLTTTTTPTYSARTNLTLSATASDASGVRSVEFYGDNVLLARDTAAPYTASWNLRKAGKGLHTVKVRAIDNAGNATERSVTIAVN
jgi:hypothetical protein